MRAAYENVIGSWASVTTDLVSFFRSKSLNVYDKLVDVLEIMANEDITTTIAIIPEVSSLLVVSTRAQVFLADIT